MSGDHGARSPADRDPGASPLPGLFAEALELDGAARQAFVAALAARDPGLAARLAELLAAAAQGDSWLDGSALALGAADDDQAMLPARVGPYRIVRELGRGGMGRVFLAEQENEDFKRTVALKVIDGAELGGERVRRFRDEVRILAGLAHPGIARFLDGGRSAEGTWFLALEYVEGVDLLEHCRAAGASVPERLTLFLAVLEAVEYAHVRGVVHRDLKPSNILVGADGRPRLLDFGISKLVSPEAGEGPVATQTPTEFRAFTPAYASPEQFRGGPASAASDIFTLGVVLYELLTGARPFGDAATPLGELFVAVQAGDAERPSVAARRSTRRRDSVPGAVAATPKAARIELGRLGRDLDEICLKALRPAPAERYASAGAFAADLRAYLDGRPVAARRGGPRYRAARFVRRHRGRLATGATLAIAAVLAGALALTVSRARQAAQPPAPPPRIFPFSNAPPGNVEALERAFAAQPANLDAGASLALAYSAAGRPQEAVLTVARLRQIPGHGDDPLVDYLEGWLASQGGERQRALVQYSKALDGALAAGRGELVAQIRAARGTALALLGRASEGRADMLAARAAFRRAHDWESLSYVLNDLAIQARRDGRLAESERLLTVAFRSRRAGGGRPGDTREISLLHNLASVAAERGRPDIGAEQLQEILAPLRAAGERPRLARALADLAVDFWSLGRAAEAEAAIDESVTLKRAASTPASLAFSLYFRAGFDAERGRLARVEDTASELRRMAQASGDRLTLGFAEELGGRLAAARGDLAAARRAFADARRLDLAANSADAASDVDLRLARVELAAGNLAAAASAAEAAAAPYRAEAEKGLLYTAEAVLARIDARSGRTAAAERRLATLAAGKAEAIPGERRPELEQRLVYLAARAEIALAGGDLEAARRDLETAATSATAAEHIATALALRTDLAALEGRAGHRGLGAARAAAIEGEARALGFEALAASAAKLRG